MLQSLSTITISRPFLHCLRATNKLWMLIRKGQYSVSKINSEAGDIKETQTKKVLIWGEEELKSQGSQWPGPVKPEMIPF